MNKRDERGRFIEGEKPHNYIKYQIPSLNKSKELAYLFGVMCGDGSLVFTRHKHRKNKKRYPKGIQLSTNNYSFCGRVKKACESLGFKVKRYNDGNYIKLMVLSADLARFFLRYKTKTTDWEIPKEIFISDAEIKLAFIKGYLDSDGHIEFNAIYFDSINKKGLTQLSLLLKTLHIKSKLYGPWKNNHNRDYYRLAIFTDRKKLLEVLKRYE